MCKKDREAQEAAAREEYERTTPPDRQIGAHRELTPAEIRKLMEQS